MPVTGRTGGGSRVLSGPIHLAERRGKTGGERGRESKRNLTLVSCVIAGCNSQMMQA